MNALRMTPVVVQQQEMIAKECALGVLQRAQQWVKRSPCVAQQHATIYNILQYTITIYIQYITIRNTCNIQYTQQTPKNKPRGGATARNECATNELKRRSCVVQQGAAAGEICGASIFNPLAHS
jgi:hypothetical protein